MRFLSSLIALLALVPAWSPAQSCQPCQVGSLRCALSHLDLFWGGTREECLSRGNRIINRAIQLADRYPEFRFLIEDQVFAENFMQSRRGFREVERLKQLVKEGPFRACPSGPASTRTCPWEATVRIWSNGKTTRPRDFGVDPQVAHMGDIPGFTRQYLRRSLPRPESRHVMDAHGPPGQDALHWNHRTARNPSLAHDQRLRLGHRSEIHEQLDECEFAKIDKETAEFRRRPPAPSTSGGARTLVGQRLLVTNVGVLTSAWATRNFRLATPVEYFRNTSKRRACRN